MRKPKLVAVDSNVLILLAEEDDLTLDGWETIRERVQPAQFIVTHVVIQELTHKALNDPALRKSAAKVLSEMRSRWRCQPFLLNAIQEGIVAHTSNRLLDAGLLPGDEKNDSLVLAQAAALDCTLLITYDTHLRGIDFERLTLLLREFDLSAPIIATPGEVVRKFYR